MLHAGGEPVSYEDLRAVKTPDGTDTHVPVPHHEIVELVRYTLGFYNHEIVEEHHALASDGARYFGALTLRSPYGDYSDIVGLRNSHDKSFPVGLAFGSRVFVCDNLAFIGEHVIKRKHTVKARRELPMLLADIVQPLQAQRIAQNQKLLGYQAKELTVGELDHAIMNMLRQDIIGVHGVGQVLKHYQEPPHDWGSPSAWRLFNAATFTLAGKVAEKPDITRRLHAVIDATVEGRLVH